MPSVLIHMNSSLESFYEGIRAQLVARYHAPGNAFPQYEVSDAEIAEQASLASYASHASDGVEYGGGQYVNGVHIERLLT